MLLQIMLSILIGILFGTITGLIPGIHINLIGVFLVSLSASLFISINPLYLIVFITAMAITHTFIDFIPSVFLGCPDTDTELSVLPGHDLLKRGHGYQAVVLTAYGSIAAIFVLMLISFPSILMISKTYNSIKNLIPYLLIIISILLISLEKNKKLALLVFFLTGFLGWSILNLPDKLINQPLLPLLTGLFGSSMLIISIKTKFKIKKQKISMPKIKFLKPLTGAIIASPLCSFLPGLGSGQAAIMGNIISKISKKTEKNSGKEKKEFLFLLGATNTLVMGFSFISLYVISKTRTGAALAIQQILGNLTSKILILILITTLLSGIASFFLTLYITKIISQKINKINYTLLSIITLIILTIIVFVVSGLSGLLILIISTLTGIYCISLNVRRTNMMGCLLIPTILFYIL